MRRQAAAALLGLLLVAGCQSGTERVEQFYDSKLPFDHPIDWWHQMQGGPIAAERPPPPGVTDPYPDFARIPPRPAPVDFAAKRALVAQFAAERDRRIRLNQQDPIAFASPNAAAPAAAAKPAAKPGAPPTPPAPDADTSRLSFDAASPSPAPAAPAPAVAAAADPHPPAALVAAPGEAPVVSGPIPAVPQEAPPLPNLPGLPTGNPAPVVLRPVPSAQVRFARGSAALPESAEGELRALAARRAGAPIAVVAGGEASSAAATAQREALPLALKRTGAITAVLLAAGVPAADIRAEALAQGREASARLLN